MKGQTQVEQRQEKLDSKESRDELPVAQNRWRTEWREPERKAEGSNMWAMSWSYS